MQAGMILQRFVTADGVETIFRCPTWGDLDGFVEMHRQFAEEKGLMARQLRLTREAGARMLADILLGVQDDQRSYLLVERESTIVGEGFAFREGFKYCVVGLALMALARGLGVGTQMMKTLEEEAQRIGASRLFLTVWAANLAARHVYEKAGYRECGRRPGWQRTADGGESDLIEMVKFLE